MKYLELTGRPDPDVVPPLFGLVADAPFVAEARLVDWNLGDLDRPTLLFSVTGDEAAFREAIGQTTTPVEWDLTPIDNERFYCYLTVDPVPVFESLLEAISTDGLIVVKPVVYRDGQVHARFVGESAVLQTVLRSLPSVVDVDVRAVGEYADGRVDPLAKLSERQREAVEVATELGYFEQPRRATHEDVAERMDVGSSTASEHLRKAQSKLVRAVLGGIRPERE